MKKYITYVLFIALGLVACNSNDGQGRFLGTSKSYDDFLWSKSNWEQVKLPTQTLQLRMGDLKYTKPIKLQVVYQDENGDYLPVNSATSNLITVYQNEKEIRGGEITICPKDTTINLQFRFNESAKEGIYNIYLKIIDSGDLDIINGEEAIVGNIIKTGIVWQAKHDIVINPLEEGLIWLCIITTALLFLWFVVLQWIVFPRFAFDNLQVVYMDGDSRKGREDCSLHGARKIICSAHPKSQSALSRLFSGRIEYLTNQFWETPVVMTPCGSSGIAVGEELKAGNASTYRMSAMITPQNGPRRPFVIKKTKSDMTANISIG